MDSWMRQIVSACLGGFFTFAAMYVTVVGKYVSRAEVSQMIQNESPYVRDEKWIVGKLEDVNTKLDELLSR